MTVLRKTAAVIILGKSVRVVRLSVSVIGVSGRERQTSHSTNAEILDLIPSPGEQPREKRRCVFLCFRRFSAAFECLIVNL